MKGYNEIKPEDLNESPFRLIGRDWMLITAGDPASFNTMTASWGGFGVLWHKNVCYIFIRPTRYTYEFVEKAGIFTLSFFDESKRDALKICGSKSGRDTDKVSEAGLTSIASPAGSVSFSEARLIVECKKIYAQDIKPELFMDPDIDKNYPNKDYHRMYVGEVISCYVKG
jgi:flavin reductase (DIM6/NTAB) family NADH-FMN oxidoreductase RutF